MSAPELKILATAEREYRAAARACEKRRKQRLTALRRARKAGASDEDTAKAMRMTRQRAQQIRSAAKIG